MGLRMCRRGLCLDRSLPETVCRGVGVEPQSHCDLCVARHEHTVKRSAFATIPPETRAFIIITADPAVVLVALPCASWLGSLQHLTLQTQIQHRRSAAVRKRNAVDATHACNSTSHWTLHPVDVATATPST